MKEGKEGVVVLAVDLPRVPSSLLLALAERWRGLDGCTSRGAVLQGDGGLEPLVGIYGSGLAEPLERRLAAGGSRAVHAWIDDLGDTVLRVPLHGLASAIGHGDPLLNVNRPDDLVLADRLPAPAPPLVSVVGWKDAGKTSVAVGLVKALGRRGWRVMALKHGHGFVLDTPGTDSHRLRCEAGAERVLMAGPDQVALLGEWSDAGEPDAPTLAARYLGEADVVVAEGWKAASLPAIEVAGSGRSGPGLWSPEAPDRDRFLARVTAGSPGPDEPRHPVTLDRSLPDLGDRLADLVETRVIPGWRR
jgi:molybdopterin-guanine dinucleotide biosynthesis protein B